MTPKQQLIAKLRECETWRTAMASKRVTLKWQSEIADCHAGPFIVTQHAWDFGVILEVNGEREELGLRWRFKTQADAKRACETLAARILGARK